MNSDYLEELAEIAYYAFYAPGEEYAFEDISEDVADHWRGVVQAILSAIDTLEILEDVDRRKGQARDAVQSNLLSRITAVERELAELGRWIREND